MNFALDVNQGRAGPTAGLTIGACSNVSPDLERAEHAQQAEKSAIRTEVSTPEVLINQRYADQAGNDQQARARHVNKKIQQFYIGNGPVWSTQKILDGDQRHTEDDQLDKKEERCILDKLQGDVQPSPNTEIATQ